MQLHCIVCTGKEELGQKDPSHFPPVQEMVGNASQYLEGNSDKDSISEDPWPLKC